MNLYTTIAQNAFCANNVKQETFKLFKFINFPYKVVFITKLSKKFSPLLNFLFMVKSASQKKCNYAIALSTKKLEN